MNVTVRIGNKWYSVITDWENYEKWADFAFKKWGIWGLENTRIKIVEGVPIGDWKEIKDWKELFPRNAK